MRASGLAPTGVFLLGGTGAGWSLYRSVLASEDSPGDRQIPRTACEASRPPLREARAMKGLHRALPRPELFQPEGLAIVQAAKGCPGC